MKKCSHCSRTASDDISVCPVCGGTDFEPVVEQTSSFNPYNYVPYQGEIKAKMKPWQIILIVLGCAAIILTAFFAVKGILGPDKHRGEIKDGVYLNEWAEIKLVIPESFDDVTASEASEYQDNYNDCELVIESEETSLIMLMENLSGSGIASTNEYIKLLHDDFESDIDMKLDGMSVGEIFDIEIAGKQFKAFKNTAANDAFLQYMCVYKKENRAIIFIVTAYEESQIEDILSKIEFYSAE